jgi:prepilin-type N-terminal cleavage/methylation domain-containing protein
LRPPEILKNKNGFTVVELVIVVTIVGMFASIAIPSYQNMVSISRQTEAKMALSAMYTAETGFFGEFSSYTECLNQAGYSPQGASKYYSTGYMTSMFTCGNGFQTCQAYNWAPLTLCDPSCASFPLGLNDSTYPETASGGLPLINTCANQNSAGVPLNWEAVQNSFTVGAAGSIGNSPFYDMWQIDNNKNITNVQSGL